MAEKPMSEAAVRKLRANIYGECSDANWDACKEGVDKHGAPLGWLRPENVEWLKTNQPKKV